MMEMVEEKYVNGVPLHRLPDAQDVDAEGGSTIFVVDFADFDEMDAQEIQDIFRRRHILVLNVPSKKVSFDRNALSLLAPLKKNTNMQSRSPFCLCSYF
jgi:hypothetical protein